MNDIFAGQQPKIIGATIYALNRTHGLAPARPAGSPEVVVEVVNSYNGTIKTDQGNMYSNGDFGITRFAEAQPQVGDTVFAKWAVGPAQRGSGWVQPNFVEGPLDAYVVTRVWAFGYYVRPVDGEINIGITRSQFEITAR